MTSTYETVIRLKKAKATTGEIASRLGREVGTIYNYVYRARAEGLLPPRRGKERAALVKGGRIIVRRRKNDRPQVFVVFSGVDLEKALDALR